MMPIQDIYEKARGFQLNEILKNREEVIYFGENWKGVLERKDIQEVNLLGKHGGAFPLVCIGEYGRVYHADVDGDDEWNVLEKVANDYAKKNNTQIK